MTDPSKQILSFGLTGSVLPTTPPNLNPAYLLSHLEVQTLLLDIAEQPRSRDEIQSALKGTDIQLAHLVKTGLITQTGEHFRINFPLFRQNDVSTIKEVTNELASDLAAAYFLESKKFHRMLSASANPYNRPDELAFILIGCFSLHWDGLQITDQLGYRNNTRQRESGDQYIPWAEERQPEDVREIYFGSHTDYYPGSVLTTFGDHYALPRAAFPDLGWRMEHQIYDLELSPKLERTLMVAFSPFFSYFSELIGVSMLALAQGVQQLTALSEELDISLDAARAHLNLLDALSYAQGELESGFQPTIPVLPKADRDMVEDVLTLSGKLLVNWLQEHIDELHERLSGLTPLNFGLTFEELFTQIYHYLHGLTNRHLVNCGFFANPYDPARKYRGFIPAVWHPDVVPEETAF